MKIIFEENAVSVSGARLSFAAKSEFISDLSVSDDAIFMRHRGYGYSVGTNGKVTRTHNGYSVMPIGAAVKLFMDR